MEKSGEKEVCVEMRGLNRVRVMLEGKRFRVCRVVVAVKKTRRDATDDEMQRRARVFMFNFRTDKHRAVSQMVGVV
jgi:hypothetical protein